MNQNEWMNNYLRAYPIYQALFLMLWYKVTQWVSLVTQTVNKVKVKVSRSVASYSLWPHGLYSSWNSPGQNTGVGSLSLLQGTFPTQGSNPGLWHCRQILYQLSHKGSPIKKPPAMWKTRVQTLDLEDPLENRMATHSSILAWRIP